MLNLAALQAAADGGDDMDELPVRRRMLKQIVAELTAGREAQAREGQAFGLPQGQRI